MSDADTRHYPCFELSLSEGVAHLKLSRPQAMNSMNPDFWRDLPAIVRDLDGQGGVRCLVISSTGKHFTAGMDLQVFQGPGGAGSGAPRTPADQYVAAEAMRHTVLGMQEGFNRLDRARFPVIVAVQGGCVGGGVDMISSCDIRYCTADAFFCVQEINIGMTADVGTFPRLCKLIPEGWVRELAYTGRRLPAAKAKEIGLVNEVFATHEEVVAHALATAREIASKAPLAVTGSKVMINYARDHTIADGLDYIATWQAGMFAPPHMAEAFKAKAERRDGAFADLLPQRATV